MVLLFNLLFFISLCVIIFSTPPNKSDFNGRCCFHVAMVNMLAIVVNNNKRTNENAINLCTLLLSHHKQSHPLNSDEPIDDTITDTKSLDWREIELTNHIWKVTTPWIDKNNAAHNKVHQKSTKSYKFSHAQNHSRVYLHAIVDMVLCVLPILWLSFFFAENDKQQKQTSSKFNATDNLLWLFTMSMWIFISMKLQRCSFVPAI